MTMPGTQPMPGYKVVGITPGQYGPDKAGNTVQGHLIRYRLDDGIPGEVLVPDTRWDAAQAQTIIEAAVRTTYAVASLGSAGAGS
ncbi:MAG TPA: hypothetical protein VMV92_02790 [Streptosporangiaceae bacterium]|nr:hypothetical protein [Streptosporangiaceae bacterium]